MTRPKPEILKKAIAQANSPFTKEIMQFSFIPLNKNHFGISVINVRGGKKFLIDYWFSIKTGKLIKSKTIETISI